MKDATFLIKDQRSVSENRPKKRVSGVIPGTLLIFDTWFSQYKGMWRADWDISPPVDVVVLLWSYIKRQHLSI